MDILSLLILPFKLIWAVLIFPFKFVFTSFGFLTHLTWAVLTFPFKLVFGLISAVTHGFVGTITALTLFIASPFGFLSSQPSIALSPTTSTSISSPQTELTNVSSDTLRKPELTLETFTQIKPGMSYKEVKQIIGEGGEVNNNNIWRI